MSLLNDLCANSLLFRSISLNSSNCTSLNDDSIPHSKCQETELFTSSKNKYSTISKIYDIANRKRKKLSYQVFLKIQNKAKAQANKKILNINKRNIQTFISTISSIMGKKMQCCQQSVEEYFQKFIKYCKKMEGVAKIWEIQLKIIKKHKQQIFRDIVRYDNSLCRIQIGTTTLTSALKHKMQYLNRQIFHKIRQYCKNIPLSVTQIESQIQQISHHISNNSSPPSEITVNLPQFNEMSSNFNQFPPNLFESNNKQSSQFSLDPLLIYRPKEQSFAVCNAMGAPVVLTGVRIDPWLVDSVGWSGECSWECLGMRLQARRPESLDPQVNDIVDTSLLFMPRKSHTRLIDDTSQSSFRPSHNNHSLLNNSFFDMSYQEDKRLPEFGTNSILNCSNSSNVVGYDRGEQDKSFKKNKTLRNNLLKENQLERKTMAVQRKKSMVQSINYCKEGNKLGESMGLKNMQYRYGKNVESASGRGKKSSTIMQLEKDKELIEELIKELKRQDNKLPLRLQCKNQTTEFKIRNTISKIDAINDKNIDEYRLSKYLLLEKDQQITDNYFQNPIETLFQTIETNNGNNQSFVTTSCQGSAKKDPKKLISLKARRLDSTSRGEPRKVGKMNVVEREGSKALQKNTKSERKQMREVDNKMMTRKEFDLIKIKQRISGSNKKSKMNMFELYQRS